MEMETPLLAGEADGEHDLSLPALSSGPLVLEETEFSRLIAQRSMISPLWNDEYHGLGPEDGSTFWLANDPSESKGAVGRILHAGDTESNPNGRRLRPVVPVRGQWGLVAASTLFLAFLGAMWSSYVADAWTRTRLVLQFEIAGSPPNEPWNIPVPPPRTLASLLQALHEQLHDRSSSVRSSTLLLLTIASLWAVALLLPCLFMVLAPSWILVDAQFGHAVDIERRILHPASRLRPWLELGLRWGWLVPFLLLWLDAGAVTTGLGEWDWTDARVRLRTQYAEGFAAYLVATLAAVGAVCVLRSPPALVVSDNDIASWDHQESLSSQDARAVHSTDAELETAAAAAAAQTLRTPPRHAFRLPRLRLPRQRRWARRRGQSSTEQPLIDRTIPEEREDEAEDGDGNDDEQGGDYNHGLDDDSDEQVSMALLEETPPALAAEQAGGSRTAGDPRAQDDSPNVAPPPKAAPIQSAPLTKKRRRRRWWRVTYCHKLLVFQLGLLSLVLWMPCWYTPFWLVLSLPLPPTDSPSSCWWWAWSASHPSPRVAYWGQIPALLWSAGLQAGTYRWVLLLLEVWLCASLLVIPLLASVLGLMVWLGEGRWSTRSRQWLYCLQPALGGVVAVTALLLVVTLDGLPEHSSGPESGCRGLWEYGGATTADVHLRSGFWSYALHSLVLEAFVGFTLRWSLLE